VSDNSDVFGPLSFQSSDKVLSGSSYRPGIHSNRSAIRDVGDSLVETAANFVHNIYLPDRIYDGQAKQMQKARSMDRCQQEVRLRNIRAKHSRSRICRQDNVRTMFDDYSATIYHFPLVIQAFSYQYSAVSQEVSKIPESSELTADSFEKGERYGRYEQISQMHRDC
jgi:hypothetical protein